MVDLEFTVEDAAVERHAASPLLLFALRVSNKTPAVPVQNVMLRCQIRIEPARRQYGNTAQERLVEIFGVPQRWGETLRSFLWTHTSALIPAFEADCRVDLPVPCSYDFNIAATKYFYGLEGGEAPLSLLFSGTIFYHDTEGLLQIEQIPWSKETNYRLPVAVWQAMMRHYYPDGMWLCLGSEVFEKLYRFKRQRGYPTWDQALDRLLESQSAETSP